MSGGGFCICSLMVTGARITGAGSPEGWMDIFLSVCSLRAAPCGLTIWDNLGILIVLAISRVRLLTSWFRVSYP